MRISATGDARDRGFTLIELLVVVVILGALAVPLTLRYGRGESALPPETVAASLRAEITAMRSRAITARRQMVMRTAHDGWSQPEAVPRVSGAASGTRGQATEAARFPGVVLRWDIGPDAEIRADAAGRVTPFTVRIGAIACASDGHAPLRCQ